MNLTALRPGVGLVLVATVACGAQHAAPITTEPPASTASGPAGSIATEAPPADGGPAPAAPEPNAPLASGPTRLTGKPLPLPGAEGPAFLDYIAYERANSRVWVPVPGTGSVDVLDTQAGSFTRVDGFGTVEKEVRGKKRRLGPSAVSLGDGFAYIGDRATSQVCAVDTRTLKAGACTTLASPSDGVAYVASAREVWVTTPRDQSVTVLDASSPSALKAKAIVKTDGDPEGYAVDDAHGLFFTNLEDKGGTLAIDVGSHKVKSTWSAGCGPDGPRGVAFDAGHDFVIVACTDHLQVLDAAHDGARLGKLETGAGVDNIDLSGETVYVAAARAGRLTVATIDGKGQFAIVATGDTAEGARNPVADARGNVYVADSQGARLLVFAAQAR
jgi:DNA-binding beta-propeller fold protein YncE